jgi:hypothetical protein
LKFSRLANFLFQQVIPKNFFKKRLTHIIRNYMMSPQLGVDFLTVIVDMPFCRIVPLEPRIMPEKAKIAEPMG